MRKHVTRKDFSCNRSVHYFVRLNSVVISLSYTMSKLKTHKTVSVTLVTTVGNLQTLSTNPVANVTTFQ